LKPIFRLSGNSRVISVNPFEIGEGLLVTGGIRYGGVTARLMGELEGDFQKASDAAQRWQSVRPATLIPVQGQ
jgi:hypothetical protein